ncbi:hypothetical protein Tco_0825878 [Tanacetum coccineum]
MMTEEYYPRNELQKMETELWNLTVKGTDIVGYTKRFQKLALLCPGMVTHEYKKVERLCEQVLQGMLRIRESRKITRGETMFSNQTRDKMWSGLILRDQVIRKRDMLEKHLSATGPLSLSFDFVFASEIFKSLSFRLHRLCHLAILCLDQHAHTLHHLKILLTISLDRLDIFEGRSCISEFVRKYLSLILELS